MTPGVMAPSHPSSTLHNNMIQPQNNQTQPPGNHYFAFTTINAKSTMQILISLPIFLQSAQIFCNFNKLL